MEPNPKDIVREGYDRVSRAYRPDDAPVERHYEQVLAFIKEHYPSGGRVLDLGCGCGVPLTRKLADRYQVTGIDLSPVQVQRAEELVPSAKFVCADMTDRDWPTGSFDLVASMYALIHVPIAEQPMLLRRIADWLVPGSWLIATVGSGAWTGTEKDWCGVKGATMYWSHADTPTYRQWIELAGMSVRDEQIIQEENGEHTLIYAQKRRTANSSERVDRHAE
jgi:2-polyprenyl-3-methyl-5-hydroxy-6-metoxy-1,4-benzoquinol methylase